MGKDKRKPADQKAGSAGDGAKRPKAEKPDRKVIYQQAQLFRDVAQWLADIADFETRERRKDGRVQGYDQVNVAMILDPHIRKWAWQRWRRIKNEQMGQPDAPIPDVPPPPLEMPGGPLG